MIGKRLAQGLISDVSGFPSDNLITRQTTDLSSNQSARDMVSIPCWSAFSPSVQIRPMLELAISRLKD